MRYKYDEYDDDIDKWQEVRDSDTLDGLCRTHYYIKGDLWCWKIVLGLGLGLGLENYPRLTSLLAASTVVLRQFTYRPTINRDRDSTLREDSESVCV